MKSRFFLLAIAYLGFISLGLPDALIGVAWPSVRAFFGQEQSAMGLVLIVASCGYFFSSSSVGWVLSRISVGALLAVSSAFVAVGVFGFSLAPAWGLFVAAAVFHGLGSGAIDAGLNHYATLHFSSKHMTWLHACYSLGAMLGPLIMTAMITRGSWKLGYASVGIILAALSLLFAVTAKSWQEGVAKTPAKKLDAKTTLREVLRQKKVWLQMLVFFFYVGVEVTVGQWSFTLLTESRQIPAEAAGLWVTAYWASIGLGRVFFGFIVEQLGIDRLLRGCTFLAVVGAVLLSQPSLGILSLLGLPILGLAISPIYPCMMSRTPQRVGRGIASHAVGLQAGAAMLGAASLPATTGLVVAHWGLERVGIAAIFMSLVVFALHEILLSLGSLAKKEI